MNGILWVTNEGNLQQSNGCSTIKQPSTCKLGPGQLSNARFSQSRKLMWRCDEIVICVLVFGSRARKMWRFSGRVKLKFFETWHHHQLPKVWRFVTKMWCSTCLVNFVSASHSKLGLGSEMFRVGTTLNVKYISKNSENRIVMSSLPLPPSYMYVYKYLSLSLSYSLYLYVNTYIYIYIYIYIRVYLSIYVYIYIHLYVYIQIPMCMCICIYSFMHIHISPHTRKRNFLKYVCRHDIMTN